MSLLDLFDNFTAKPFPHKWVIDKFFDKTRNTGPPKFVYSPKFKLSSGAFNLELSCSFNDIVITTVARDNISAFNYRISLINIKGQKCNTQVGPGNSFKYKFKRDALFNKANALLPEGKLTVCCEIFELSNYAGIQSSLDNLFSVIRDNESLLDSGKLSDVVLAVGGRELKAHKLILSARSVVFEKMFEHDFEESKRNRVEITDMSDAAAEDLLKYIYTGKVTDLSEHVYELYAAADKYQIDSLKSYCELYLEMSISISTVAKTYELAELYSLVDLKSKCFNYINRHSTEFKFDDWKELTTRQPGLMFQVFVQRNHSQ